MGLGEGWRREPCWRRSARLTRRTLLGSKGRAAFVKRSEVKALGGEAECLRFQQLLISCR